MGTLFVYILKSAVCLVLFYLFYRLLLSKETFHRFNRIALLGILLLSLLIPLIEITTTKQMEVGQAMLTIEQLLMMAQVPSASVADAATNAQGNSVSWIEIALLVYLSGILFFACRNLYSLSHLLLLLKSGEKKKFERGIVLIVLEKEIAPFSWMKYIVISRKDMEENGREILIHESAHIRNRHSLDLLIADICIFFQWFNPGAWLLKQELQNIHEYEADETVIKEGVDAKLYQLLLIKKAVGTRLYSMANSFNHSKLKKRITMMLKEKSNPWARLKYLYVLPLAAIAVTAFARPEVSEKAEEISAVKVNDLAAIVKEKKAEFIVTEPVVTDSVIVTGAKRQGIVVVGTTGIYPNSSDRKDSTFVFRSKNGMVSLNGVPPNEKPLALIDGKEVAYAIVNALNPERIKSISVEKNEKTIEVYGEKAKYGVLRIELLSEEEYKNKQGNIIIRSSPSTRGTMSGSNFTMEAQGKNSTISIVNTDMIPDDKKPLIIINGIVSVEDDALSTLSADRIESISVLKDKSAMGVYGEKGKNGVILVNLLSDAKYQMKKNQKKDNAWQMVQDSNANLNSSTAKLYFVDGKSAIENDLKNMKASDVYSINTDKTDKNETSVKIYSYGAAKSAMKVKGTVKDAEGKPIVGATVSIQGTPIGTTTDKAGKFELQEVMKGAILVISFADMNTVKVKAIPDLKIVMKKNKDQTMHFILSKSN